MTTRLAAQHAGEFEEVAGLAAGAGTDVSAVQFDVPISLASLRWPGSGWHATVGSSCRQINHHVRKRISRPYRVSTGS